MYCSSDQSKALRISVYDQCGKCSNSKRPARLSVRPCEMSMGADPSSTTFSGARVRIVVPQPLDGLRPVRNLLNLIEHENRSALAGFGRINSGGLPLLLDPIPAPQRGLVGTREASTQVMSLGHLPHQSCYSDLARAGDRLDEAARLTKTAGERRSLRTNEGQGHPLTIYSIR